MGAPWRAHPSWECVERLGPALDCDVAALLLDADAATLERTDHAQACTFALSLVVVDAARRAGLAPAGAVAGHSLGEYTALVVAGALDEEAGARLVAARGAAMRAAADERPGTMAAVLGLDVDAVGAACAAAGADAWVANDNAPGQVVIAGTTDGIATAGAAAKAAGASRVVPLPVGGAFHSPLMAPAQGRLDAALQATSFRPAEVPVVANVDASDHLDADWAPRLSAQLCARVRWRESLARLAGLGVAAFVELGPGDALTGMVKRTVPSAARAAVGVPDALEGALEVAGASP